jgi:hypothetical protein
MAATRAERQAAANRLAAQERAIISHHLEATPTPQRPRAPVAATVDERALREKHERAALVGLDSPRRWHKQVVAELAAATAGNEARRIAAALAAAQAVEQRRLDEEWARFTAGDPLMVGEFVGNAFRGQHPRVEIVDTDGTDMKIAIAAPSLSAIPEKMAAVTPTGLPTVKARAKGARNELYAAHLGSVVLAAVRRVLTVAPSVQTVEVVLVREVNGQPVALLHSDFERARVPRNWADVDPYDIEDLSGSGFRRGGRNGEVTECEITTELRALLPDAAKALGLLPPVLADLTADVPAEARTAGGDR